jgi:hypothetical protein
MDTKFSLLIVITLAKIIYTKYIGSNLTRTRHIPYLVHVEKSQCNIAKH